MYTFKAPAGGCFGVVNNTGQKKSIPLTKKAAGQSGAIRLAETIQLFNTGAAKDDDRKLYVAFDITNDETTPQCFVKPDAPELVFFASDGEQIALYSTSNYLHGTLLRILTNNAATFNIATNTCLAPGQTLRYFNEFSGLTAADFNQIAYAETANLSGTPVTTEQLPNLAVTRLDVVPPDLAARFVNDTGAPITLMWASVRVAFLDSEGYVVGQNYIYLDRTETNNLVIESGDILVFSGSPLMFNPQPMNAIEMKMYLEWNFQ